MIFDILTSNLSADFGNYRCIIINVTYQMGSVYVDTGDVTQASHL